MCDLWICVDVVCCCASIFNMTAIAIDRYIAITLPFFYKVRATLQSVLIVISVVWLLAILITLPTVFAFGVNHHAEDDPTYKICAGSTDSWAHLTSVISAGFVPWVILLFVYSKIIVVLTKQKRKSPTWKHRGNIQQPLPNATDELNKLENAEGTDEGSAPVPVTLCDKLEAFMRDHKGCAMLGSVISVYFLCWFPFFFITFITSVSHIMGSWDFEVSGWTYQRLVWLGYVNSAVNPFIYAMFIPEFRQSVKQILMFRCSGMESRIRAANYTQQMKTHQITSTSQNTSGTMESSTL